MVTDMCCMYEMTVRVNAPERALGIREKGGRAGTGKPGQIGVQVDRVGRGGGCRRVY